MNTIKHFHNIAGGFDRITGDYILSYTLRITNEYHSLLFTIS